MLARGWAQEAAPGGGKRALGRETRGPRARGLRGAGGPEARGAKTRKERANDRLHILKYSIVRRKAGKTLDLGHTRAFKRAGQGPRGPFLFI